MTDSSPTTLYRLYNADGGLLYVGIAGNPGRRFEQHRQDKPWWGSVANIRLEHFPTRDAASEAELKAIRTEHPQHNIVGREMPTVRIGGFTRWLSKQRNRDDRVGDFARDVKDDPLWKNPQSWDYLERYLDHYRLGGVSDGCKESARKAWDEFMLSLGMVSQDDFRRRWPRGFHSPEQHPALIYVSYRRGGKDSGWVRAVACEEAGIDPGDYPDHCDICLNTGHVETVLPHLAGIESREWLRAIYRCDRHSTIWWSYWTLRHTVSS